MGKDRSLPVKFVVQISEFGIQNSELWSSMEMKSEPFWPSYIFEIVKPYSRCKVYFFQRRSLLCHLEKLHRVCSADKTYHIEDIWLFQCKIDFYFTEWTPKVVFSRVAEPRVKILLLVFMSEIKIDLTLKKSNFLFLLCFKNAIVKFIPMRQQSRQRNSS